MSDFEPIAEVARRLYAFQQGHRPVDPALRQRFAELLSALQPRLRYAGKRPSQAALERALAEEVTALPAVRRQVERMAALPPDSSVGHRPPPDAQRAEGPASGGGSGSSNTIRELKSVGGVVIQQNTGNIRIIGPGQPPQPRFGGIETRQSPEYQPPPFPPPPVPDPESLPRSADPPADLELRVEELDPSAGDLRVTLVLDGRELEHRLRLRGDPRDYVQRLLKTVERPSRRSLLDELEGIGLRQGCRLLGEGELMRALWKVRAFDKTLLLRSDEPWIPWEMIRLVGPNGEPGPPLCRAFRMTRWLNSAPPPPARMPMRRLAVVPVSAGEPHGVQDNLNALLALDGLQRNVTRIEARLDRLLEALRHGSFDGWHFCGHGPEPTHDAGDVHFRLDDFKSLTPNDLPGARDAFSRLRPAVFMSACYTGRLTWDLAGMGGWAEGFLTIGAGVFVGSLLQVDGEAAARFSEAFYRYWLLERYPLGKAVHLAREEILSAQDAAWLGFSVYGHPLAVVG